LTQEEKQALSRRAAKLKEQANKLKDSASEPAMESYDQAQTVLEAATDTLTVSGHDGSARSVEADPLIIRDSAR
jgi:hypothetical protein